MLLDEDYQYLESVGLVITEVEEQRFLIFENFSVPRNIYVGPDGEPITECQILYVVPEDYNQSGGDMFWTFPQLRRADGGQIPAVGSADSRNYNGKIFERWSRHWGRAGWRAKVDNVAKIVDRITWALSVPEAKR